MSLLSDALMSQVSGGISTTWCNYTECFTYCEEETYYFDDGSYYSSLYCYTECYSFDYPC